MPQLMTLKELCAKHKKILMPVDAPIPYSMFGIECGEGWYSLLDELLTKIEDELKQNPSPNFYVTQIKEKFGGLRFYVSCASDKIHDWIHEAERDSTRICECCGKPAKTTDAGWYVTLCPKHLREYNKGKRW